MTRRSANTGSAGFSLFPFLAVLLCVMGALIVVLVVIARQARAHVAEAAKVRAAERTTAAEDREARLAALRWRCEQLRESREKTAAQLEQQRLELSHIEDHARALGEQLAELESAAATLAREPASDDRKRADLRSELAALTARAAAAQADLDKARRAAAERTTPSYAIVPYQGPNQTHRRPLYIECSADGVVLQPEGIVLGEDDFVGPLGPGNPLAAALRAQREYLARNRRTNRREEGEPYPLLLVRPDGIGAYYAAREAMTSWGSDFGYELIDQDWKLDFNAPNPELTEATRTALEEARLRQRQLALAAPRRFADGERPLFRASPTHGGLVREGGSRGSSYGSGRGSGRGSGFGKRYGQRGGGSGADDGDFGEGNARAGSIAGKGGARSSGNNPTPPNPYEGLLAGSAASGSAATDAKSAGHGVGDGNDGVPGGNSGLAEGDGDLAGGTAAAGGKTVGDNQADGKAADGDSISANPLKGGMAAGGSATGKKDNTAAALAESTAAGGQNSRGGGSSTAQRAVQQGSAGSNPNGTRDAAAGGQTAATGSGQAASASSQRSSAASAAGSSASSSQTDPNSSGATPSMEFMIAPTAKASLAQRRGKNWGLPETVRSAVPITRPLRIDCWPDRLVVRADEKGAGGGKVVPLKEKTEDSIEELVSIVWGHIDSWGSAGRNMYWRPILSVDVQPGAAGRFADLQILLADSGLDVRARSKSFSETQSANTKRR
jgi:hypothetical protein